MITLRRNERWLELLKNCPMRLIGTFRAKGDKQYVCVRRGQPAVKMTLEGHRYNTVLIGLDDPESEVEVISRNLK